MTADIERTPWRTNPRAWSTPLVAEALATVADWLADTDQLDALELLRAVPADSLATGGADRVSLGSLIAAQHAARRAGSAAPIPAGSSAAAQRQAIHLEHLDTGLVAHLSIPAAGDDALGVVVEDSLRSRADDWHLTTWLEPADPQPGVERSAGLSP